MSSRDGSTLLGNVQAYYSDKLREHGATSKGVDWKDETSQILRFQELLRLINIESDDSVLDYGCGLGALYPLLKHGGFEGKYTGFDISREMIEKAAGLYPEASAEWVSELSTGVRHDHVIASGIFNVKLEHTESEWQDYMLETLEKFNGIARKSFVFNVLTSYSDKEYQRPDLHYADPLKWFDHCKRRYSRQVILNHGYPLYEFSLAVIKEGAE